MAYAAKNRHKWNAWKRKYHAAHRTAALVAIRQRYLKRTYNLTPADYLSLFESQNGVCAICFSVEKARKNLSVDHNHATGAVRGLLCSNCNLAIGHLKDDPLRARAVAVYLEERSGG